MPTETKLVYEIALNNRYNALRSNERSVYIIFSVLYIEGSQYTLVSFVTSYRVVVGRLENFPITPLTNLRLNLL